MKLHYAIFLEHCKMQTLVVFLQEEHFLRCFIDVRHLTFTDTYLHMSTNIDRKYVKRFIIADSFLSRKFDGSVSTHI